MLSQVLLKALILNGIEDANDIAMGNDANKDTAPNAGQTYYSVDLGKFYYCEVDGTWIEHDENKIIDALTVQLSARPDSDYAYFFKIDCSDLMTGGAAQKTYTLGLIASRPVGSAATGDSNDALIKGSYSNYAANDSNFIIRGVNVSVTNRDGGILGMLDNSLGVQGKSGGTVGTINGLSVIAENYGTVNDVFGGVDVLLKNEAAVATLEYGIRVRNENNSLATKVTSAILVSDTGANNGFTTGLDLNGATLTNEIVMSNGVKVTVSGDDIVFTNSVGDKSYTITMV